MLRGLWGWQSANNWPHFCRDPTWMWAKMLRPWEMVYTLSSLFWDFCLFWGIKRHKMTYLEGYTTQRIYSADIFCGIAGFLTIVLLKTFLSYRPLKNMWADPPTAMRFRVNLIVISSSAAEPMVIVMLSTTSAGGSSSPSSIHPGAPGL